MKIILLFKILKKKSKKNSRKNGFFCNYVFVEKFSLLCKMIYYTYLIIILKQQFFRKFFFFSFFLNFYSRILWIKNQSTKSNDTSKFIWGKFLGLVLPNNTVTHILTFVLGKDSYYFFLKLHVRHSNRSYLVFGLNARVSRNRDLKFIFLKKGVREKWIKTLITSQNFIKKLWFPRK